MSDTKQRKCGSCGQIGHNKRTCKAESSMKATYAVLSRETGKDGYLKEMSVDKEFTSLDDAIAYVNKRIETYISDYDLTEDYSPSEFKDKLMLDCFQVINLKIPDVFDTDPDSDGTNGNLRLFIQKTD